MNIKKLITSFQIAFYGIYLAFAENQTLGVGLIIGIFVLIASIVLQLSFVEFIIVATMIVLVLSAEMINTAIEEVVNLLVQEHKREAKIAKDVSAGMVLLIILFSGVVGLAIFIPHIWYLLQGLSY